MVKPQRLRRRAPRGLLTVLALAALAGAQPKPVEDLTVEVGGQSMIPVMGFARTQVVPDGRCDVLVGADGVTVRGREAGDAKLYMWDATGNVRQYRVSVVPPGGVDRALERRIAELLAADPATRSARIAVRVTAGEVTLTGSVASKEARDRALALVQPLVRGVHDSLVVGPGGARLVGGAGGVATLPPILPPGSGEPLPPLRAPGVTVDGGRAGDVIELRVGEAVPISVPTQLKKVLTASPEIADVIPMPPREVVVTAKAAGETTLMLWYVGGDAYLGEISLVKFAVRVVAPPKEVDNTGGLPTRDDILVLLRELGISGVQVYVRYSGQTASVILLGTVATREQRARAEQAVAALFPPNTRITNFIVVASAPPRVEDYDKRAAALEKLLAQELPNASIRVRLRLDPGTERLRALLSGEAYQPSDRLRAEEIVRWELGDAVAITNDLTTPLPPAPRELAALLAPPAPKGDDKAAPAKPTMPLAEAIAQALQAAGVRHDAVRVSVLPGGKRVVLNGTTRNDDDRTTVTEAVAEAVKPYGEIDVNDRNLVVKKPRVVTEVQVVEMGTTDGQNLGLVYGMPYGGSSVGGGGGGTGTGTTSQTTQILATDGALAIYGARRPGDPIRALEGIGASLRALVTNNRAKVLSQPNITSDNDAEGLVEIVSEIPLPSSTSTSAGNTASSVEFRPVGIRLVVTPSIVWGEPDQQISLNLQTEVSAVDFSIAININGSVIPAVTTRRARTVVTVADRETLVIGGLTTETERKNMSRLPFISDIPVLGSLFRYTDKRKEQTTVVLVMKPHILY